MFVGVWPSDEVCSTLARLPRRDDHRVRWTRRENWHVTLRFLGDLQASELDKLIELVDEAAARMAPVTAVLGPTTRILHRAVLMAPVTGLDKIARAVADATYTMGEPPERRFTGHLTLARPTSRREKVPFLLAGKHVGASWPVRELAVIQSQLGGGPANYFTIATAQLRGAIAP